MTPSEIEIEIQTYLISKLSETTYSDLFGYTFEGVELSDEPDPTSDSWILFRIVVTNTEDVEISKNGIGIRYGNLYAVVNTSKILSNGRRLGLDLVSELEKDLTDYSTENINFKKPNPQYINNPDWHKFMLTVPFYTTIGE